jgi:hypothetical protein
MATAEWQEEKQENRFSSSVCVCASTWRFLDVYPHVGWADNLDSTWACAGLLRGFFRINFWNENARGSKTICHPRDDLRLSDLFRTREKVENVCVCVILLMGTGETLPEK